LDGLTERDSGVFTGIVEAIGTVTAVDEAGASARVTISAPGFASGLVFGESVAVSGVCLTVTETNGDTWTVDVMKVTREFTTLGFTDVGTRVNLERAAKVDSRLGGHLVQGHVDGIATLVSRDSGPEWEDFTFRIPSSLSRYIVSKGSVAVDGVSLTVASVDHDLFTVSLIPVTLKETILGDLIEGDRVNVEVDVIGKYVESLLGGRV
jgi:riboflavin synthase